MRHPIEVSGGTLLDCLLLTADNRKYYKKDMYEYMNQTVGCSMTFKCTDMIG